MDLTFRPETLKLAERVRRFVDEKVAPLEESTGEPADAELQSLREEAKRLGLWAPQAPREAGGQGIELPEICPVFEAAGRSLLGPLALGCAAPDEGNGHLLRLAGTPAQKEELLAPLQAGEIRSAFAMTEPAPGSGSDPAMMQTTARLDGDRWVIDGRKWFVSGAVGAAFTIVAAVTGATTRGRKEITLFLVENGTPGFRIVRQVPVLGGATPGGHAEIELSGCGVFPNRVLGEVGKGYDLIQARLGPARLTHCMRWLGAATRALELAVRHARERRAFGKTLGEHE
ncbi:MAG TPA: acyl-CoA dehydrogenase family protein, partial [Planctomycetota bacterium]|nr:acyl-CoA dehydrogenase family protein [Planctomycetota bacterium]